MIFKICFVLKILTNTSLGGSDNMGWTNAVDGSDAVSWPDEGGPDAVGRPAANVPGGVVVYGRKYCFWMR